MTILIIERFSCSREHSIAGERGFMRMLTYRDISHHVAELSRKWMLRENLNATSWRMVLEPASSVDVRALADSIASYLIDVEEQCQKPKQ